MGKLLKTFLIAVGLTFGITLQEAEKYALENFFEVQKKKEEVKKAKDEIYRALSELFPRIDLTYSYFFAKKQDININTPFFLANFTLINDNFYRTNFLITQNIFNPIVLSSIKVARANKNLKNSELEALKNEIKLKVRKTYITALKLRATVQILKKQIKRLEEHYKNVKALYEEGYVALKDLLETKVKLYEVKNQLSQAKANYQKALDMLSFLTGVSIEEVEEVQDFPIPTNIDVSQNPKLTALNEAVHLARTYVDLVTSYFYPVIDLTVLYQKTNESPSLPKDRYFISINFKWNLFSGGKRIFELRKAQRNLKIAQFEYLKEKNLLRTELKGILRDIKVLQEEIKTAKVRLLEAKEHYRLAIEKYKNGLGTNAEVLDAEAYLTSAEQELKIKKYELLSTKFKLLEVLGR